MPSLIRNEQLTQRNGGTHMSEPSPLVRGFGNQLRTWREYRKISRDEVGDKTGFSASMIGAFERGERIADDTTVQSLDAALNAHRTLAVVGEDLEKEQYPKNWEQLFTLEAAVTALSAYDTHVMNGLLQTEAYARAVFEARVPRHSTKKIDCLLSERLARQALLTREPFANLCFILEESLLRRRTGGAHVMRGQLQHLLRLMEYSHVQVLVLPFESEEPVDVEGPMTLLEAADKPMMGYAEVQGESFLIAEKSEVSTWRQRFAMIQVHALRPADSARLIQRQLEEL